MIVTYYSSTNFRKIAHIGERQICGNTRIIPKQIVDDEPLTDGDSSK